ncbi:MAG TPA: helix-turn-helix transcriptional regulator [Streptosporangiaceae bacterium]|nr:helix-turn-helix transcriptional regulator [Streptosporangiaceae bacterium]
MSPAGQPPGCQEDTGDTGTAVFVADFPMPAGTRFDWHTHEDHQLAWAASGVLTVLTAEATWVLPPTRALWIPAGLPHETASDGGRATMRSLYIRPGLFPAPWIEPRGTARPTPVKASPLLAELIGYLGQPSLDPGRRAHAETLLADLLTPVPVTTIAVRLPASPTARRVAEALRAEPADRRTLRDWGREVGASERTLARAFTAEAGLPFGRWRTLLRLQAALSMLAAGDPVSRVAVRVGYDTPSAFTAAFRRETGQTPGSFFTSLSSNLQAPPGIFKPRPARASARCGARRTPACPRPARPSG